MSNTTKAAVFISYSSKDSQYARALSRALEERGLGNWYVRLARTEEPVRRQLEQALESSSLYVFLLSEDALTSPSIFFELGAALGSGKRIMPIYFSDNVWRRARTYLPTSTPELPAINARDLKPKQVADKVVAALAEAA
jgi:hypothetical protein